MKTGDFRISPIVSVSRFAPASVHDKRDIGSILEKQSLDDPDIQ
jgi:hypothetical protein